jgi:hypothetical protein
LLQKIIKPTLSTVFVVNIAPLSTLIVTADIELEKMNIFSQQFLQRFRYDPDRQVGRKTLFYVRLLLMRDFLLSAKKVGYYVSG